MKGTPMNQHEGRLIRPGQTLQSLRRRHTSPRLSGGGSSRPGLSSRWWTQWPMSPGRMPSVVPVWTGMFLSVVVAVSNSLAFRLREELEDRRSSPERGDVPG